MVDFSDEKKAMAIADELEANVVSMRAVQLYQAPINGAFDREHLQMIHGALFQDFPQFWLENEQGLAVMSDLPPQYFEFSPGQFRDEVDPWDAWRKGREYGFVKGDGILQSFYSRMDDGAHSRLDSALNAANPEELSKLNPSQFAERMAGIYAELDYVHPFQEGNSRALREFARELADRSGYELDWSVFNTPQGREQLYAARDLSLADRARQDYRDPDVVPLINKSFIELSHRGFSSLTELFQETDGFIKPLNSPEMNQNLENEKPRHLERGSMDMGM